MKLRQWLIQFGRKIESTWSRVEFTNKPWPIKQGWYITEFKIQGELNHVPELLIETAGGNNKSEQYARVLRGAHVGHNRMLFSLPDGKLIAHDKLIQFDMLSRVSLIEGRARVLLICFRVLRDFFSFPMLGKLITLQFSNSLDLSTDLLQFYHSKNYLYEIDKLERNLTFHPWLTNLIQWRNQDVKVAVLLEDKTQLDGLKKQAITVDGVLFFDESDPSKLAAEIKEYDYILPLQISETLHPVAIYKIKQAAKRFAKQSGKQPTVIYSDHDYVGETKVEPVFKPSPSLPYYYCYDYIGPAVAVASSIVNEADLTALLDDSQRYPFVLNAFIKEENKVVHIDEVLFRSVRAEHPKTLALSAELTCWPTIKQKSEQGYSRLLAKTDHMKKPSVDLVVPTRDGLNFLKPCIDSILRKTEYANFGIIIVDNGSEKDETLDYFKTLASEKRVKLVSYPGEFNYSAINNFAVKHSKAEYVGLVNNDVEVINDDWLTQMMAWAQMSNVGIVGAKLFYANGDVQHAGVTIGLGNAAGHIHRLEKGDSVGYQHRCVATQKMMAVTAACLITPRILFDEMNGLDEVNYKVAYNDIDYCLRVEQAGYDVLWTPEAQLYHYESVSRGDDMSEKHIKRYFAELGRFQKRWKSKGFVDKYYSKHLRITDEGVYPQFTHKGKEQLKFLGGE